MTKDIYILGIHDGHNSGASLCVNGRIVASVSEERLSRTKNEVGYPRRSIEDVLRIGGVDASQLTEVTYASLFMHSPDHLTNVAPWYRVGMSQQKLAQEKPKDYQKVIFDIRKKERIEDVVNHLGVAADKVTFVEHHEAHLAAAYFSAPNAVPDMPMLGLTCDGAGDNLCATVSICRGNTMERIAKTNRHASLGKIYSRATLLMGMKPWEHEYKLMGLAPYADPERTNAAAEALRKLLAVDADKLEFHQAGELSTNFCYEYLRDNFEMVRFDTIAGAVQQFTEEALVAWVKAAVAKTGIRDLVCGGGVFMNVKANMLLADLPEVNSIYVMPSGGDESLSIGACLLRHYQRTGETDHSGSVFDNLYLGGSYDTASENSAVAIAAQHGIQVTPSADVDGMIAGMLAQGEVVARARGRMEWGARALGNRSILARADKFETIDRINRSIKMRDFWMPFAPSIRQEAAGRYFDDPKSVVPQFMTFAFRLNRECAGHLTAASHPRDRTIRPQVVTAKANPGYHRLIGEFEKLTGFGGLMNTSYNLHGEPIVYTAEEAVDVFVRSGLKHLALESHVLSKPGHDDGY